jgi:hypothetical protein
MVYFISLRGSNQVIAHLSQSELSVLEHIAEAIGIHTRIERIENGSIFYLDKTFPEEELLKFKKIYLTNAQIFDKDHLPEGYLEWYDSVTQEIVYYLISAEHYLQNVSAIIREFIGSEVAGTMMADIYKRNVRKMNNPENEEEVLKKTVDEQDK